MNKQELIENVRNIINDLYEKNQEVYGSKVALPEMIAQLSVHATSQILEQLGLIQLPKD